MTAHHFAFRFRAAFAALLFAAVSCSGGDSSTDPKPGPNVDVTITLGSATVEVTSGSNAAVVQISINRPNGFSGTVSFAASAPGGITTSFTPPALSGTATQTLLNIIAGAGVTAGNYNVTVTASGTGVTTSSVVVPVSVKAPGNFTLAAAPAALSVEAGAQGTSALTIARTGSFAGAVALTATGAPAGVTVTFDPASPTGTTSGVTFAVGAGVAPGVYPITVRGNAVGLAEQTTVITLTVPTPPPPGGFTLSAAPAALSVHAGQQGVSTVTITRDNGFAGTVALTATGAPAGVTVSFDPASAGGASSQLSLTVGAEVAPGVYPITVLGNATGIGEQTTVVTLTVTAPPGLTLAVAPTAVSVEAGQQGAATVTLTRLNGFADAVALTATGAPAGVTVSFDPASVAGTTSQMSIVVGGAVAPGAYPITVRGNATGITEQTAVVTLTVTAPPAGDFTLAANPAALSVEAGQQGVTTLTLTRLNGFAGAVALTATGAPAGVTVNFVPASVVALTSEVTLTVGGAVAAGAYPITVHGNATGLGEKTVVVTLTVTAAPIGGSGNTTWTFCGSQTPVWFAFQNGSGAWTRVLPSSPGVFQFDITLATGGVAFVQSTAEGFHKKLFFATQSELQETGATFCPNAVTKTNTGSVTGGSPSDLIFVTLGGQQVSVDPAASLNFSIPDIPSGPRDLIAARSAQIIAGFSVSYTLENLVLRRNVNLGNNAELPVIDFGGGESFAPSTRTLTLSNTGGDFMTVTTRFETANNRGGGVLWTDVSSTATRPWYGVPTDRQQAGDKHQVLVSATPLAALGNPILALNSRSVLLFTAAPQNAAIAFGPSLTAPAVSVLGTAPYVRMQVQYTPQADYNRYFVAQFQEPGAARIAEINMTSTYAGGTATLGLPDFSGVSGFNNDWGLRQGNPLTWTFAATGWSGGGIQGPSADGAVAKSAQAGAQITP